MYNDKITYEYSFNVLESIKNSAHVGEEIVTIADFCQDLLSDKRLSIYPDIEVSSKYSIVFNYETNVFQNHLVIKINDYGFGYDDKVLSYFYIKGDTTSSKEFASWNEVIDIIEKWKTND